MLNKVLVSLKEQAEESVHPFFAEGKGGKTLVLVIATDKGLCGALQHQPVQEAHHRRPRRRRGIRHHRPQRLRRSLDRLRKNLARRFPDQGSVPNSPKLRAVGQASSRTSSSPANTRRCCVAFNNFVNTVTIVPTVEQLLPVNPVTLGGKRDFEARRSRRRRRQRPTSGIHL